MRVVLVLSVLFVITTISNAARILGVVPVPSYSHQIAFTRLWKELSLRGHEVTLITSDPMNDPSLTNLTEINTDFSYEILTPYLKEMVNSDEGSRVLKLIKMFSDMTHLVNIVTRAQLRHPPVQNLIQNQSEHFDVVMVELFEPSMLAFGKRFKCPTIGLLSIDAFATVHSAVGNPVNPVAYPDMLVPFDGKLSFTQKLLSLFSVILTQLSYHFLMYPLLDKTTADIFGKDYPSTSEMMENMDLLFLNANPMIHNIRPVVPAVVYFGGGTHLQAPKPLPNDIKDYLDSAKEGFIYFSLGSNVKSKDIPVELREIIMETLAELPYKIMWKFEAEVLPGKPENVKIMKWLPQQDILRHPNIKVFITQGGQQSMEEAIFTHVPLVVMPFMADQENNARKADSKGYGIAVDHKTLTKDLFKETILEVIKDPKYRNAAKHIADLALDQPMTGLEKAVWWTEYVLRHKGAKHLRSPAIDMPWYEYLLLDVIAFLSVVFVIISFVLYKLVKFILRYAWRFTSKKKLKTK